MPVFHRLNPPIYVGGLPVTHDYINDPVANGYPTKSPAPADGMKSDPASPNEGTYFKAFGEDATALFMNRPEQALAENDDYLDNIVNWAFPMLAEITVASGSPMPGMTITDPMFVGVPGRTNSQYERDQLALLVDWPSGVRSMVAGVPVYASLIHDGASNNVIGTEPTGFRSASTTVNFSATLPAGGNRRLIYFKRASLATIMGGYANIDAFARSLLRGAEILNFSGGSAWLDASTNPATHIDTQLKKFITDLIGVTAGSSGAEKIGSGALAASFSGAPYTLTAESIYLQLRDLLACVNGFYRARTVTANIVLDDAGYRDSSIYFDTTGGGVALTFTNPALNKGRRVRLIDTGGYTETEPITLLRYTGTNINGCASFMDLAAAYGQWWAESDGVGWWVA